MSTSKAILFIGLLCIPFLAKTQDSTGIKMDSISPSSSPLRNFFKVNLTAILLKNYSFQYERVISQKVSFAIGFRTMPNTSVPFKNSIVKAIGDDDQEAIDQVNSLRLSNMAITPEFRFYPGKKGYGRGFYVAPFYRYAVYHVNNIQFDYDDDNGEQNNIAMSGKLTGNTFGLLLGAQYRLGKHISLDMWYLGPHYGNGKGDFNGTAAQPLDETSQNDLRQTLEDIDLPLTHKTVTVNSNGANVKLDGPFGGMRVGILLAVRF